MDLKEIESLISSVAKVKNLSKETILNALKESLKVAAQKYTGINKNMEVEIDSDQIAVYLRAHIVDDYPDVDNELSAEEVAEIDEKYMLLNEAQRINPDAEINDYLEIEIPIENFGRTAINITKQTLLQQVLDTRKAQIYAEYKSKENSITSGTVQQIYRGHIFLNFGDNIEGILPFKEQIRKERYRQGDSIKALILEVNNENKGHQVILSRSHPNFLIKLFEQEVPEISDKTIQVHSATRDPGFRAKISVSTDNNRIDPVGSCVGLKGNRVQAIVRELSNERIDIVNWSSDLLTYIRRALSPTEIIDIKIIGDRRAVITVEDDDLAQAIGRGGQNVRLASKLVDCELDVYGKTEFENLSEEQKQELLTPKPEDFKEDHSVSSTKEEKFSELESTLFK